MNLFSVVHTLLELIGAIDTYSTSSENLAESLKTLKDKLSSTRGLLVKLEEFVQVESSNATPLPSHSTLENSSQSSPTMQLINDQCELQALHTTLNDISAWLGVLGSKSNSKKLFSITQLRSSQDDQKKVSGFLVELESCKSSAGLVLSLAIRYVYELAEQRI